MFKKILKIKISSKKLLLLFMASVMIISTPDVLAQAFRIDEGIDTKLFELAPKNKSYLGSEFGGSFNNVLAVSTNGYNAIFRLFGTSLYDNLSAISGYFDNFLLGSYGAGTIPTTELQTKGTMEIEQLGDVSGLGNPAYLCIDDFGIISRCEGVAVGTPACKTPVYAPNNKQQAVDTATGCDGGLFFDKVDPSLTNTGGGVYEWGCRGITDSIALTPSHPSDASCSHPNASETLGDDSSVSG